MSLTWYTEGWARPVRGALEWKERRVSEGKRETWGEFDTWVVTGAGR